MSIYPNVTEQDSSKWGKLAEQQKNQGAIKFLKKLKINSWIKIRGKLSTDIWKIKKSWMNLFKN